MPIASFAFGTCNIGYWLDGGSFTLYKCGGHKTGLTGTAAYARLRLLATGIQGGISAQIGQGPQAYNIIQGLIWTLPGVALDTPSWWWERPKAPLSPMHSCTSTGHPQSPCLAHVPPRPSLPDPTISAGRSPSSAVFAFAIAHLFPEAPST